MGKYQLIYFPIRGRAECIRLLFIDNGIDYEDIVIKRDTWATEWKHQFVFGQVPAVRDAGLTLVQSNAILRYLARKHDLYGNGAEEAARLDMINDGVEDLRTKYANTIYRNYDKKDEFIASLQVQLQPFEKLLSENEGAKDGFCVRNIKSFADYNLVDLLDILVVLSPSCLDNFPTLVKFREAIGARPNIAKYRKTEFFTNMNINGVNRQ